MFEHRLNPLLSRRAFLWRLSKYSAFSLALMLGSLVVGMIGYHGLERMPWIDAFVNAAMLMGGMGPLGELHTFSGKLFAGIYALYCGLLLIVAAGIIMAPVIHRLLHRFHLEAEENKSGS